MQEQMSQEEIDRLLADMSLGEVAELGESVKGDPTKYQTECREIEFRRRRLIEAYNLGDSQEVAVASLYLHNACHTLWLKEHGYTRQEWRNKVIQHFKLHPEHYWLYLLKSGQLKYGNGSRRSKSCTSY